MNRAEITNTLTDILVCSRLSDRKYYAKEVTLDYGTSHPKRVDVMQFVPQGVTCVSDIEKGIFICYEIKSCKEDLYSGNGLNFFGEKNYIVMTMQLWKSIQDEYRSGKLGRYLAEHYPESSSYFGILVAVPSAISLTDTDQLFSEFENPTEFTPAVCDWQLWTAIACREGKRNRSTSEMLFYMLRSKHSCSNQ